jgi:hypothetical protein
MPPTFRKYKRNSKRLQKLVTFKVVRKRRANPVQKWCRRLCAMHAEARGASGRYTQEKCRSLPLAQTGRSRF